MDEFLLRFDKNKKYCFLDYETENLCLYTPNNLPWQVAMIALIGDKVVDKGEYMRYIKWYRPPEVSPEASFVTKFDPKNIALFGTDYKEVISDVVNWTSEADYIVGHNVLGFDIHFLSWFYLFVDKSPVGLAEKVIDTHALAKGIKLNQTFDRKQGSLLEYQYKMIHTIAKGVKTNTKTLGSEYGIEHDYENLHDALVDLQLNIKIWDKIKHQVEI